MKTNQNLITFSIISAFVILCSFKAALFNFYVTDSTLLYSSAIKLKVFFNIFFMTACAYLLIFRCPFRLLFIITYFAQAVFLTVNLVYYFYFEGYLHFNQYFELWAETYELMKHSAVPFEPRILIIFIDLPFFLFLAIFYKKVLMFTKTKQYRFGSYIPAFLVLWNFHKWDWVKDGTPIQTMTDQYVSEVETIKKFGLLTVNVYHIFYLNQYKNLINKLDYGTLHTKTSDQIDSCSPPNNVVIIQIESMESFVINNTWHNSKVAPHLYAMSRKYIYYPYMLSYHKAGSTSDCEFSCVNSVEALDMFPSIKLRNYAFPNALPKRFTKNNYDVAMFHGNRGEYFNRRIAFKKMGYPAFYDIDDMKLKEVVWGAPDGDVMNKVLKKVHTSNKPFYYHTITMSSHEPFIFVDPYYSSKKYKNMTDKLAKRYYNCISYVDSVVYKFVNDIRHEKPNTTFIIFGDHTPAIKESKIYKQAGYKNDGLYFEFVPLIIITPDNKRHFEKKRAVSFLDIAPTALESSNIPYSISSLGENLLEPDSLEEEIPYRGVKFTRTELYQTVNDLYTKSYKVKLK